MLNTDDPIELSDDSVDCSSTTVLDMLPSNNRKELNLLFPQREDYMSISNDPTSSRDQKKSKKANKFIKNSKKKFSIPTDNLPQLDLLSTEKGGVGKLAGGSDLIPLISTGSAYSSKTIPSTSLTATVASSFSLSKTDTYPSNAFENSLSSTNIEGNETNTALVKSSIVTPMLNTDDPIELSDDSVDCSSTTVLDMLPSNNRKELNLLFPQREDYMSISNDPTSSRDQKKSKKANKFIKNSKKKFSIPTDNLPQLDLLSTEKGGVGKLAGGSDLIPLISTGSAYSSKTIPSTSLTATVASSFSLSKTDTYPSNAFENSLSSTNIEVTPMLNTDDPIELSDDSVDCSSTTVLDMLPSNNRKELNLLFPQREDYMSISNDPTSSRDQKKSKKANKFIKNSKKKFSIPTDNLPQLDLLSTEKGGVGKLAGGSDLIPLISTGSAYSSKTIPSTSLTATVASSFSLSKTDTYPSNAFENSLSSTNIEGNEVFP
ncbi:unnamed protein product [Ceratitis capitata]|uniref:(Mediterranean fruit fly) hypothetical protein n=1 Tax=Ceratitis capitata TaxID=7213 RepID=A0A811UTR6_CERCA|nr:unnamed protein product [Ceratitis capitata]